MWQYSNRKKMIGLKKERGEKGRGRKGFCQKRMTVCILILIEESRQRRGSGRVKKEKGKEKGVGLD